MHTLIVVVYRFLNCLIVRVHTGCRNKLLCCYRMLSFDELLKFVLMRSVFCAKIVKIDQSGFHVKKKTFLKGFLISELFWTFFFFRCHPMPFGYEHCSNRIFKKSQN